MAEEQPAQPTTHLDVVGQDNACKASTETIDPLAPDAPIHHILSIRHNPLVANMTIEQLGALVQRCRTLATSAPSMSSKLKSDSDNVNPRRRNPITAKRKALLDTL